MNEGMPFEINMPNKTICCVAKSVVVNGDRKIVIFVIGFVGIVIFAEMFFVHDQAFMSVVLIFFGIIRCFVIVIFFSGTISVAIKSFKNFTFYKQNKISLQATKPRRRNTPLLDYFAAFSIKRSDASSSSSIQTNKRAHV
jgi:hypothetical protein